MRSRHRDSARRSNCKRAATWTALALGVGLGVTAADAEIRRHPTGVNVNAQGATSVFITFGGLAGQVPVEAIWCGELEPAPPPDRGQRCVPGTIFGQLPIRYDQSRLTSDGTAFTDIMSIPPSVARRAYQAAARGETSSFFYVRRFVDANGISEFVTVTCRLTGGGARVPLALLDVRLGFDTDVPVQSVQRGETPPPLQAEIAYTGSGRLMGRWEVVLPGEEPPSSDDLLTEATLPADLRPLQRRYTQLERFNVFLPPTGHITLPGPEPELLPTQADGLYLILLRIEASDDKEGNSNLGAAGAGQGVVRSGGVAGFPMPALRYVVGSVADGYLSTEGLALLAPAADAVLGPGETLNFSWSPARRALFYRLEIVDAQGSDVHSAVVQQGIGIYRVPPWIRDRAGDTLRWRVLALGPAGEEVGATEWRSFQVGSE